MSTTIVVPVHNEAPYLATAVQTFLERMPADIAIDEIILAENGSTDGTREVCATLCGRYPECVRSLYLERPSYGDAIRAGMMAANGTVVTLLDSDFLNHAFLKAGLTEIQAGADLVVGSKGHPGAADRRPWRRRLFSRMFRVAVHLATGYRGSDTRGMKVFRREVSELALREARADGDAFQTEIVVLAWRAGLRIREVPLDIRETRPSRNAPLAQLARAATGLFKLASLHRFGARS